LLLGGGHHTSITLISSCVYWLLKNPEQLAALAAGPSLVSGAVEETIRYDTPLQSVDRLVGASPAELGGYTIEPGTRITLLLGAANRDPEVFGEPDEFLIDRPTARKHVSFGLGAHFCLGAPAELAPVRGGLAYVAAVDRPAMRTFNGTSGLASMLESTVCPVVIKRLAAAKSAGLLTTSAATTASSRR
jgi:cytochrome P450